jgi:hypothetical protein
MLQPSLEILAASIGCADQDDRHMTTAASASTVLAESNWRQAKKRCIRGGEASNTKSTQAFGFEWASYAYLTLIGPIIVVPHGYKSLNGSATGRPRRLRNISIK